MAFVEFVGEGLQVIERLLSGKLRSHEFTGKISATGHDEQGFGLLLVADTVNW